jgi:uncharacterized protein (TIRG00374 family)
MRREERIKKPIVAQWKIVLPALILLAFGLALILFDRQEVNEILSGADWRYIPGALFFVACSNGLVSLSYILLARLVGIRMDGWELGASFYTTNVMNRLMRGGGAAGFSLRYLIMNQFGVNLNDVLNSSFIHFLLGSLIMLAMLPLAVIYITLVLTLPPSTTLMMIFLAAAGLLMGVGAASVLFSDRLRQWAARLAVWLARVVARRDASRLAEDYTNRAAWAAAAMRRNRGRVSLVMLLLLGEWASNVIILGYCLRAFGVGMDFGGAAAVYVTATMAGVISALPGGIGVQEGLVTSLVVLQGASFEQAALGALLYRILQTFLPFLISLTFYPRLLKVGARKTEPSDVRI